MSNYAITAVLLCSQSKGAARLALLCIADRTYTNTDYYQDAKGLRALAELCNCTERPLQRCLNGDKKTKTQGLVQIGELVIVPHAGPRGTDRYYIPILNGEAGYDPQPCQGVWEGVPHICNGCHTPLDRSREQTQKNERDRRQAESRERAVQQSGANSSTSPGAKISTPSKVVPRLAPGGANNSTPPVPIVAPAPANIGTTISHIPNSLPNKTHAATPPLHYEPEPEQTAEPSYPEVAAWIKTLIGRAALLPHGERAQWSAVLQREVCIEWAAKHPDKWQEWRTQWEESQANRLACIQQDRGELTTGPGIEPVRAS